MNDSAIYLAIKLYRKSAVSGPSKKKKPRYAIVNIPIYNELIRKELMELLQFQLHDNTKARQLDNAHNNFHVQSAEKRKIRAQSESYKLLKSN